MRLKFHNKFLFRFSRKIKSFPSYIGKRHIYIIPTWPGLILLSVIFVIFIGSFNENNNMGLLFSFFLFSLFLISILDTRNSLLKLKIHYIDIKPAFAGEDSEVFLRISTEARQREMINFETENNKTTIGIIKENCSEKASVLLSTNKRGIYKPKAVTISCSSPLGIFKAFCYLIPDNDQVVYPKPSSMGISIQDLSNTSDIEEGKSYEDKREENYKGLREYIKGDSIKRISWKAYSKGLGLYVKEFDFEAGPDEVYIVWDRIKINDTELKLEKICKTILDLDSLEMKYGLFLPQYRFSPASGEDHKKKCLTALAEFKDE